MRIKVEMKRSSYCALHFYNCLVSSSSIPERVFGEVKDASCLGS
jgi:hypothetical protein